MANDLSQYAPAMWKADPASPNTADGTLNMMFLFGIGDHGGGPTRKDLDTGLRWQQKDVVYPELHFDTAGNYFNELHKNEAELKIPTFKDELYFEYHRGVQTTQAEEKKHNRKSEVLILDAEKLAAIDTLFGGTYPKAEFETAWKNILFNQFHDILPGSGIHINYVDAAAKYDVSDRISKDIIQDALNNIAGNVGVDGPAILVFNPLPWPRNDVFISGLLPSFPGKARIGGFLGTCRRWDIKWLRSRNCKSPFLQNSTPVLLDSKTSSSALPSIPRLGASPASSTSAATPSRSLLPSRAKAHRRT